MVLIAQGDSTIVVEVLPDSLLVVDECGKIKELPVNPLATEIYSNPLDTINGVCLLCGPGEADTKRNQLQAEYDKAHPKETSWGKDLFLVEMETPQWNPPEHREERTIKK